MKLGSFQYSNLKVRGIMHVDYEELPNEAELTTGTIGDRTVAVSIHSPRGRGINSTLTFYV